MRSRYGRTIVQPSRFTPSEKKDPSESTSESIYSALSEEDTREYDAASQEQGSHVTAGTYQIPGEQFEDSETRAQEAARIDLEEKLGANLANLAKEGACFQLINGNVKFAKGRKGAALKQAYMALNLRSDTRALLTAKEARDDAFFTNLHRRRSMDFQKYLNLEKLVNLQRSTEEGRAFLRDHIESLRTFTKMLERIHRWETERDTFLAHRHGIPPTEAEVRKGKLVDGTPIPYGVKHDYARIIEAHELKLQGSIFDIDDLGDNDGPYFTDFPDYGISDIVELELELTSNLSTAERLQLRDSGELSRVIQSEMDLKQQTSGRWYQRIATQRAHAIAMQTWVNEYEHDMGYTVPDEFSISTKSPDLLLADRLLRCPSPCGLTDSEGLYSFPHMPRWSKYRFRFAYTAAKRKVYSYVSSHYSAYSYSDELTEPEYAAFLETMDNEDKAAYELTATEWRDNGIEPLPLSIPPSRWPPYNLVAAGLFSYQGIYPFCDLEILPEDFQKDPVEVLATVPYPNRDHTTVKYWKLQHPADSNSEDGYESDISDPLDDGDSEMIINSNRKPHVPAVVPATLHVDAVRPSILESVPVPKSTSPHSRLGMDGVSTAVPVSIIPSINRHVMPQPSTVTVTNTHTFPTSTAVPVSIIPSINRHVMPQPSTVTVTNTIPTTTALTSISTNRLNGVSPIMDNGISSINPTIMDIDQQRRNVMEYDRLTSLKVDADTICREAQLRDTKLALSREINRVILAGGEVNSDIIVQCLKESLERLQRSLTEKSDVRAPTILDTKVAFQEDFLQAGTRGREANQSVKPSSRGTSVDSVFEATHLSAILATLDTLDPDYDKSPLEEKESILDLIQDLGCIAEKQLQVIDRMILTAVIHAKADQFRSSSKGDLGNLRSRGFKPILLHKGDTLDERVHGMSVITALEQSLSMSSYLPPKLLLLMVEYNYITEDRINALVALKMSAAQQEEDALQDIISCPVSEPHLAEYLAIVRMTVETEYKNTLKSLSHSCRANDITRAEYDQQVLHAEKQHETRKSAAHDASEKKYWERRTHYETTQRSITRAKEQLSILETRRKKYSLILEYTQNLILVLNCHCSQLIDYIKVHPKLLAACTGTHHHPVIKALSVVNPMATSNISGIYWALIKAYKNSDLSSQMSDMTYFTEDNRTRMESTVDYVNLIEEKMNLFHLKGYAARWSPMIYWVLQLVQGHKGNYEAMLAGWTKYSALEKELSERYDGNDSEIVKHVDLAFFNAIRDEMLTVYHLTKSVSKLTAAPPRGTPTTGSSQRVPPARNGGTPAFEAHLAVDTSAYVWLPVAGHANPNLRTTATTKFPKGKLVTRAYTPTVYCKTPSIKSTLANPHPDQIYQYLALSAPCVSCKDGNTTSSHKPRCFQNQCANCKLYGHGSYVCLHTA